MIYRGGHLRIVGDAGRAHIAAHCETTDDDARVEDDDMSWVMSSHKTRAPYTLHFFIGRIKIAEVTYISSKKEWVLNCMTDRHTMDMSFRTHGPFNTASEAMKKMHRLLNEPSIHH